jgi:hypothetical protein
VVDSPAVIASARSEAKDAVPLVESATDNDSEDRAANVATADAESAAVIASETDAL